MKINLHKNARTTPAQRAFIQNADQTNISDLALMIGVSETTVRRWKNRNFVFDKPHTPNKVKTAMTPQIEAVVVLLRICLHLGLDDLLQVVQKFIFPDCSRSSLNRLLKRYHISRLTPFKKALPKDQASCLDTYHGTYFYYNRITLPHLPGNPAPFCAQTLLDCSFRYVYADICMDAGDQSLLFLQKAVAHFPLPVLGIMFTDPITFSDPDTDIAASAHDPNICIKNYCQAHNLTPFHLKMVPESTMDLLKQAMQAIIQKFPPGIPPSEFDTEWLLKNIWFYNTRVNLRALKRNTPSQAIQKHYIHFPNSFKKNPKQSFGTSPGPETIDQ